MTETVQGQFINRLLDKEELEKSKELAREIIQRNKRLGDLLAGKEEVESG